MQNRGHVQTSQWKINEGMIIWLALSVVVQYCENNKALTFNHIFAKQPLHNPTSQWDFQAMFLDNNIESVNEQPIRKCVTLNY